jgi:hypothetical protein
MDIKSLVHCVLDELVVEVVLEFLLRIVIGFLELVVEFKQFLHMGSCRDIKPEYRRLGLADQLQVVEHLVLLGQRRLVLYLLLLGQEHSHSALEDDVELRADVVEVEYHLSLAALLDGHDLEHVLERVLVVLLLHCLEELQVFEAE